MPGGVFTEGEPFGNEATAFIKEQIMQKEVEIEVETMDKGNLGALPVEWSRQKKYLFH